MRKTNITKRMLFESIMKNISKEVRNALNESDSKDEIKGMSISHGTLRNVDLITSFMRFLMKYDRPTWSKILNEYEQDYMPAKMKYDDGDDQDAFWDSEQGDYMLDDLFSALDKFAPIGYYFGASEGDGSDFGFWIADEDELNEGKANKDVYTIDVFNNTTDEGLDYPMNLVCVNYYTLADAVESAKEVAKYYADESDDIEVYVMAGEYETPSGNIFGEPNAIETFSNHEVFESKKIVKSHDI